VALALAGWPAGGAGLVDIGDSFKPCRENNKARYTLIDALYRSRHDCEELERRSRRVD
jgi:hypothetical protein